MRGLAYANLPQPTILGFDRIDQWRCNLECAMEQHQLLTGAISRLYKVVESCAYDLDHLPLFRSKEVASKVPPPSQPFLVSFRAPHSFRGTSLQHVCYPLLGGQREKVLCALSSRLWSIFDPQQAPRDREYLRLRPYLAIIRRLSLGKRGGLPLQLNKENISHKKMGEWKYFFRSVSNVPSIRSYWGLARPPLMLLEIFYMANVTDRGEIHRLDDLSFGSGPRHALSV